MLPRSTFISIIISNLHGEVYWWEYSYHVTTIEFPMEIKYQLEFYQGELSSQWCSRNHVVKSIYINIHTVMPHHTDI